jgi:hypothetical protein
MICIKSPDASQEDHRMWVRVLLKHRPTNEKRRVRTSVVNACIFLSGPDLSSLRTKAQPAIPDPTGFDLFYIPKHV